MNDFQSCRSFFHDPFKRYTLDSTTTIKALKGTKIAFVIGSIGISGGTNVILSHIEWLLDNDVNIDVYTIFEPSPGDVEWHPVIQRLNLFSAFMGGQEEYDVCIFTWWRTVYFSHLFSARASLYFVQSVESRFDSGTNHTFASLASATYSMNVPIITIASWIQDFLSTKYGACSFHVTNGIDKHLFTPFGDSYPRSSIPRVLVEGSLGVAFKQTEYAMSLLRQCNIPHETWLLTPSIIPGEWRDEANAPDKIFSSLPYADVPRVMRSCHFLFKTSLVEGMFGPPLEMMHCGGVPIVFPATGFDEYIIDKHNSFVLSPDGSEEDHLNTLTKALTISSSDYTIYRRNALESAKSWPSKEYSAQRFWAKVSLVLMSNPKTVAFHQSGMFPHMLATAQSFGLAP